MNSSDLINQIIRAARGGTSTRDDQHDEPAQPPANDTLTPDPDQGQPGPPGRGCPEDMNTMIRRAVGIEPW